MGQVFKKYWTNVSKKPKGFKFLGSNIYEYQVWFRVSKEGLRHIEYNLHEEIIPTHYDYVGDYGERKINKLEFIKSVKKITGLNISKEDDIIHEEIFKRDGINVPFVEFVTVPDDMEEKYLEYRDMRERVRKINQLTKKMK